MCEGNVEIKQTFCISIEDVDGIVHHIDVDRSTIQNLNIETSKIVREYNSSNPPSGFRIPPEK